MGDRVRETVFSVIRNIFERGAYSNIELANAMKSASLQGKDRAFCALVVNGVVERALSLDFFISKLSSVPVKKIDKDVLAALRMGLYQLFYTEVPDNAACNESVALIREKSKRGFVNAVLRNACRRREELKEALEASEPTYRFSVGEDVCRIIKRDYGEKAEEILTSFFEVNPSILRVNTVKTDRKSLAQRLEAEDAEVCEAEGAESALIVTKGAPSAIKACEEGLCFFQGLSSQRAVRALGAEKGQTVIDMCACPGGKSFGAAIDMEAEGRVFSFDIHANKLSLITNGAERLGLSKVIKAEKQDGRERLDALSESADRVICDVPCSGIGAIKGRPEIRYKDFSDLSSLIQTQRAIALNGFAYLKKGGVMVYSTCTLNKQENEDNVKFLLGTQKDAVLLEEETVLPTVKHYDGFYIAKILKK